MGDGERKRGKAIEREGQREGGKGEEEKKKATQESDTNCILR